MWSPSLEPLYRFDKNGLGWVMAGVPNPFKFMFFSLMLQSMLTEVLVLFTKVS